MLRFLRVLRILIFFALVAAGGLGMFWLFDQHFAINGTVNAAYTFAKKSPVITELGPNVRVGEVGEDNYSSYQPIVIDPVYFSLTPSIPYDYTQVCLTYEKPQAKVIYFGPQFDEGFNYELDPIHNVLLDQALEDDTWNKIYGPDHTFLAQRQTATTQYDSIDGFIDNLPPVQDMAVFNVDLDYVYKLRDYERKSDGLTIDTTIRGPHTFYVYVKNEPLDITFTIQDLNRHEGEDEFTAVVLQNGQGVYSKGLGDDGYIKATDPSTAKRTLNLYVPGLKEGAYVVDLHTNQDIFIRKIETRQSYLVVKNNLYLADSIEYQDGILDLNYQPNTLYTNGRKMSFRTTHKSGIQTLKIDDDTLELDETHKMFYHTAGPEDMHIVYVPDNDVVVHAGGLISFTKDSFFDPNLKTIDENTEYLSIHTNYILAKYQPPEVINDTVRKACRNYFFKDYYLDKGNLKFMISIPGLELNEQIVKMYQIDATLVTQPLLYEGHWLPRN